MFGETVLIWYCFQRSGKALRFGFLDEGFPIGGIEEALSVEQVFEGLLLLFLLQVVCNMVATG